MAFDPKPQSWFGAGVHVSDPSISYGVVGAITLASDRVSIYDGGKLKVGDALYPTALTNVSSGLVINRVTYVREVFNTTGGISDVTLTDTPGGDGPILNITGTGSASAYFVRPPYIAFNINPAGLTLTNYPTSEQPLRDLIYAKANPVTGDYRRIALEFLKMFKRTYEAKVVADRPKRMRLASQETLTGEEGILNRAYQLEFDLQYATSDNANEPLVS